MKYFYLVDQEAAVYYTFGWEEFLQGEKSLPDFWHDCHRVQASFAPRVPMLAITMAQHLHYTLNYRWLEGPIVLEDLSPLNRSVAFIILGKPVKESCQTHEDHMFIKGTCLYCDKTPDQVYRVVK